MNRPIPLPNTGGLDKNSDPLYVRSGDQTDCRGMDFSEEAVLTQTTQAGNVRILDFGEAVLQNQKTRINLPAPYVDEVTISLLDINKNVKGATTVSTGATLTGVKQAIINFLQSLPYSATFENTGTTIPYLDVTIGFAYADYIIEVTNGTTDILVEAISNTGVGRFMPIGSYDLLDDVFYWLTTQRNLSTPLNPITNVYTSVNSQVGITSQAHGLSNNDSVAIGSVVGVPGANGIYTVTVVDANNFYLNNSFFSGSYTSGGTGFKNIYGYGCIGVVVENPISDDFTFTPLLRSKKLNLVTKKQIYTPQIQTSGDLIQMYYTDYYNVPRVTYYRGAYQVDGCIRVLYPNTGQYAYATLNIEISQQVNVSRYDLQILDQLQVGGNIIAGNARYAIRFLTESLSPSELSLLTPSIPVFAPSYVENVPSVVYGSPSTVTTKKINRISLTGITPGVFKYVELIYFQYLGEGQTTATAAFNIRREQLAENQTSIVLEHNGNEPGITFFDAQLANQVQPAIIRSKDNVIIDNRLVNVNVGTSSEVDLTDFCKTIQYSIIKFPVYGSYGATTEFEFYDPLTTTLHTSYQQWEWYRHCLVGRFRGSGGLSNAFFLFDWRLVTQADYDADEFISTNGTDRRDFTGDTFTTYDLCDDQNNYYQFGLELKNIDWNFQIDGVPIRDIFSEILVFRAERVAEVLASGIINLAVSYTGNGAGSVVAYRDYQYSLVDYLAPFVPGAPPYPNPNPPVERPYSTYVDNINTPAIYTKAPKFGSFYSPDVLFGDASLAFSNGDKILSFGSQKLSQNKLQSKTTPFKQNSFWSIYWGGAGATNASTYSVVRSNFADTGGSAELSLNNFYFKGAINQFDLDFYTLNPTFPRDNASGVQQGSYVFEVDQPITNTGSNTDFGLRQAIYFRSRKDKYGSTTAQNQVFYTGYSILVDETSKEVYGGDVFTQQMWLKKIYVNDIQDFQYLSGGGAGFNIISQNRVNANLRLWDSSLTNNFVFPVRTQNYLTWLQNNPAYPDQIADNNGYILRNNVQYQAVFDPEGQDNGRYLSRTVYSELKPNNSKVDYFRIILPLSFQDAPEIQGAIMRALVLNKTLFILQKRGFTMLYFNSQGTLLSADIGQVLVGDGAVLNRIGNSLSEFGLAQSGAVVKGRSQSGKDTAMWVNTTFTNILRFGDDGIRNISLRDNMRIFFNKNLRWANDADTPADGFGITGVWDNENSNYVFTVKAWKPYSTYKSGKSYVQGGGAILGTISQGVPQIWIALVNTDTEPSDDNADWLKADIENPDYYNCFTFVYSEIKNKFTFFPYFLPNFYANWRGKFLTGYADLDSIRKSELYLHGDGNPNEFYGVTYDGGQVELVLNWQPNLNKKPLALHINSNVKPARVEIQSLFRDNEQGEVIKNSFLTTADFETREGYQYAPVKLETDSTGSNEGNSSDMEGIWTKFRIIFPAGVKCKINDSIVDISITTRNFTK